MKKQIHSIILVTIIGCVVLFYQNCGSGSQGSMFGKSSNYGMPYELKIDQVAYMSCSSQLNIPNEDGVFFTFRVGAYGNNSGVRITPDFFEATKRKDNHSRMDILGNDIGTSLRRLQFALRQQSNLFRMFVNGGSGDGIEEIDYDTVMGDLGTDEMSATLLKAPEGQYVNYWPAGGVTRDSYFEGTMVFDTSENIAEQVRSFVSRDGVLALAYADATDPSTIITPYDYIDSDEDMPEDITTNIAFGLGLKFSFKQATPQVWGYNGAPHANNPKRILASVSDYNLVTGPNKSNGSWTCPQTLQLRIIYPDDADNPDPNGQPETCPLVHDPAVPSSLLKIVRRSLPVSDWWVNLNRQCVVPKRYTEGSCYGMDEGQNPDVTNTPVYDIRAACSPEINPVCTHFVSICTRNN